MIKLVIILVFIIVLLPSYSYAQVPGDINCSGAFNGLDIVFLISYLDSYYQSDWIDTLHCAWLNGDFNDDGLYHTVADWWNIIFFSESIGDNPPLPNQLDSLVIQDVYASPGDTVRVPFYAIAPEMLTGVNLHFRYDNTLMEFVNIEYAGFFGSDGFHEYDGGIISFQMASIDPVWPDHNQVGEIIMAISPDTPPGSDMDLELVSGIYYPCGLGNYSIPTYFIAPVLVDGVIHVITTGTDENKLPEAAKIHLSNYPNPFNASTVIEFYFQSNSPVELTIYDLLGREIDRPLSLLSTSGHHEIVWDGTDYPSGIYFYRLETREKSYTQRMTLLK